MKRVKCEFVHLIILLILNSFSFCQSLGTLGASTKQKCLPDQSSYLLQLKQEFTFEKPLGFPFDIKFKRVPYDIVTGYPKMKSWKVGSDCCSWDGVTCNMETGEVIGLNLSNSWLHGPIISNSSLFSLSRLQTLNLAYNNFSSSTIPSKIGRLTGLTHLDFSYSLLSGQIPLEISQLTKLISLDLCSYRYYSSGISGFHGEFPIDIFFLPDIETISLFGNLHLKGTLPQFGYGSSLRSLDLSGTKFSGKLPDSIGNLNSLTTLHLSSCNFLGSIPSSLGNLSNLVSLVLRFNHFTGQIPPSVGNLAKLHALGIGLNDFIGGIPSSLGNLSQLTHLDLSGINLNGNIPAFLANFTQLEQIYLSNIQLTGSIPSCITALPNLKYLDLSYNLLTGIIPSSLFAIPSLLWLNLQNNQLTGVLDFDNVSSSQLEVLILGKNQLSGPIPRSILKLVNLRFLSFSFNNIRVTQELDVFFGLKHLFLLGLFGTNLSIKNITLNSTLPQFQYLILRSCNISEFPNFLRSQNDLHRLDLSDNQIKGHVPKWFLNIGTQTLYYLNLSHNAFSRLEQSTTILPWKMMDTLDLNSNKLQGSLPIPLPSTTLYFAADNEFFGKLPPSICELSSLMVLDLSNNNLNGMIPQCLGNFSSDLLVLNLQRNNFQGILPQTFINGSLRTLDLSHNQLQGKLPRSLVNCENLEVLNLGNNQIDDIFPFWLETLPVLQVLILRSNNFDGSIHHLSTKFNFPQLRIIDISHNNFIGNLSQELFGTLKAMTMKQDNNESQPKYIGGDMQSYYTDSVTLMNKGVEMVLTRILTIMTAIDLSNNRFHGEIPDSIGNLKGLVVLNLSSNAFTGHIPSSMENLTELESMDLSQNHLSGEIPPQLASLTFLAYLDLSNNQIVGPIPQGRQFATFSESSFDGNAGLCGFPLPNKCGDIDKGKQSPISQQDSVSTVKIDRTAMLIGCGCGLLNGLVTGWIVSSRMGWFTKHSSAKRRRKRRIRPLS